MRQALHTLTLLLILALFAQTTNAAASVCTGDPRSAAPQLDPSPEFAFAYFRLNAVGRRMYCDEIVKVTAAAEQAGLIVVFVHGWKHEPVSTDDDVKHFRELLKELSTTLQFHVGRVMGVFVGWPANSGSSLGAIQNVTFWNARDRADRVERSGEISKLLEHLNALATDKYQTLVVIGHSFGARIVFESVQQTIASNVIREGRAVNGESCSGNKVCHPVHGFGDLVVLLNPAFEAAQYTTFHQFSGGNWARPLSPDSPDYQGVEYWPTVQPTLMLTLGSETDSATATAWPLAHMGADPVIKATLTNYYPYITHELRCAKTSEGTGAEAKDEPPVPDARQETLLEPNVAGVLDRTRAFAPNGCATLTPVGALSNSPFVVARVGKEIMNGHDDIWSPALKSFLVGYISRYKEVRFERGGGY